MAFRDRLLGTLRLLQPVLAEPGVLVVGSEVPNLLQPGVAATLVVSQDVDIAVPVDRVQQVKALLGQIEGLTQSAEEPSIFLPDSPSCIEANFLGIDVTISDAGDTYVKNDPELPLMVFGPLGLLRPGPIVEYEGLRIPLPRPGDLMLEKLVTDRTGEKGARDLLVVAGLLACGIPVDVDEMAARLETLSADAQHAARSSLTVLSLMVPHPDMPDPIPLRDTVRRLLARLEA